MPLSIDDPLRARAAQIENDRRREFPSRKVRKTVICLSDLSLQLMKAQGELVDSASAISKAFSDILDTWTGSNEQYLIDGIVPAIHRLEAMYDTFAEEHKTYLQTDWPVLVVKAIADSRHTRNKIRLDRVVSILKHSAELGDVFSADRTEEFVGIVLQLGDSEITVLRIIYETQVRAFETVALANNRPVLRPGEIDNAWTSFTDALTIDQKVDLPALCRRLESFGLVVSVGGGVSSLEAYGPWSLLLKGKQLVEHLRTSQDEMPQA